MSIPSFVGLTLAVCLGPSATAQITMQINEIYASHTGADDMEFIELKGTPKLKLDSYMILIVEGDGSNAGTLDRAWDLSGEVMPDDGYFVFGDSGVANVDVVKSGSIENGTDTFYLVRTKDVAKIIALLGTDMDPSGTGKTIISTLASIVDLVAMIDSGVAGGSDRTYDNAQELGPDGKYLPAGVYRALDLNWCDTGWLDFNDVANTNAPSTAGAINTAYCGKATIAVKGNSCLTGAGTAGGPDLSASPPSIGKSFVSTIMNGGTGAVGLLYAGVEGRPTAFLRCSLHLNPAVLLNLGVFTFSSGTGKLSLRIPYSASLLGARFATQAAVGTPTTLHLTNALLGQLGY